MDDGLVEARWSSIERVWRATEGNDCWLLVKSENADRARVGDAIDAANDAADASVGYAEVAAEGPFAVASGMAFMFKRATSRIGLHVWVETLCDVLGGAGVVGSVVGAPHVYPPEWMTSGKRPVAFSTWSISPEAQRTPSFRLPHWRVEPDTTLRLTTLADQWVQMPDATMLLSQDGYTVRLPAQDVRDTLARSLPGAMSATVAQLRERDRRARIVSCFAPADAIFHDMDPATTWDEVTASLTAALVADPSGMRHGFIRWALGTTTSSTQVDHAQPLHGIDEPDYRYNKHLYDRFLPDVHGVQVVQTAHLMNAADLSGWDVIDLGHDRHLVRARDLEPWYAHGLPDPHVLAQGRRDWAGALLTKDIIAADPCRWID